MTRSYNILIVENSDFLREKIAGVLSRRPNVWMVTQVSNYSNLLQAARQSDPDVILVDMRLASSKKETIAQVSKECPDSKILLFADDDVESYRKAAGQLGAHKVIDLQNLVEEFQNVLDTFPEYPGQKVNTPFPTDGRS